MQNRCKNTPMSPDSFSPSNYTRNELDKLYAPLKRFLGHTSVLRYPYMPMPISVLKCNY